ncbi:olfactory receptor 5J3-like [Hyperolius riggenbachi]|uniref:olfactory receptor 5J3-like n=1 Tax=Hyperolius riggenbachi TaxID=752182 RepID=UPI0035A2EB78
MNFRNKTQVRIFVLVGLTEDRHLTLFLFILFLLVYLVSILANCGMIALIHKTSRLQTPMYTFLSFLSLVDIFYSSVITPKMLADLISIVKTISFSGCAIQFFFFAILAVSEALLLSAMSYDRYLAICHPLNYVSLMTKKKCVGLILVVMAVGSSQAIVQTTCVFTLEYCGPNVINHFFCDIPPLLKLSCSETLQCDLIIFFFVSTCGAGSLMTILVSYTLIVLSILDMKTKKSRQKAFSTCSSHLMCLTIFYGTIFFSYLRPTNQESGKQDRVVAVLYTVVIPMINPLIYSLRNQEVKRVINQAFHRK